MPEVLIYTKSYCSYCDKAKQLLRIKSVDFKDIDVEHDQAIFDDMVVKAGGRRTVPQIFIDGKHIGGCDDLVALNNSGKLDKILGIN